CRHLFRLKRILTSVEGCHPSRGRVPFTFRFYFTTFCGSCKDYRLGYSKDYWKYGKGLGFRIIGRIMTTYLERNHDKDTTP
ncbi:hypothetical protein VIGAN_03279200, partial [Vigna angularis var. angularis]